jgi:hypothetical protein
MDRYIIELTPKGKPLVCLEVDHRPTEVALAALLASDLFEKVALISRTTDRVEFMISGPTAVLVGRELIGWNPREYQLTIP